MSERTARPSAVESPSSSSTTRARMLNRGMPRWIISRTPWYWVFCSRLLPGRAPHEECLRPLVQRTEPAGKQIGKVFRRIDVGESGIDGEPEVVVVPHEREPGLFVCEQAIDHHQLIAFRGVDGAEDHGAVAEEHVRLA